MRHAQLLVAVIALTPVASTAQVIFFRPGVRVRVSGHICPVTHPGCYGTDQHYVGTFVTWNADTLVVAGNFGDTVAVLRDSVTTLEVRAGRSNRAGMGAGGGAGVGGLLGLMAAGDCAGFTVLGAPPSSEDCRRIGLTIGALGGALVGVLIGAGNPVDSWREVPLNRLRVSFGSQRDGRFGLGASVRF